MSIGSTAELDDALVKMRAMLGADGFELLSEAIEDRVSLTVVATPDACAECLVPRELFVSIAADALSKAGITIPAEKIDVTYPATDAEHL